MSVGIHDKMSCSASQVHIRRQASSWTVRTARRSRARYCVRMLQRRRKLPTTSALASSECLDPSCKPPLACLPVSMHWLRISRRFVMALSRPHSAKDKPCRTVPRFAQSHNALLPPYRQRSRYQSNPLLGKQLKQQMACKQVGSAKAHPRHLVKDTAPRSSMPRHGLRAGRPVADEVGMAGRARIPFLWALREIPTNVGVAAPGHQHTAR